MHSDHHAIYMYVHLKKYEEVRVYNENDGPAPTWVYGQDGRRWRRRTTRISVVEDYEPKDGDYVLTPLTLDDVPQLAVLIGTLAWAEMGANEEGLYNLEDSIAITAHGLAREIQLYGAGMLTIKGSSSGSEEGQDRGLPDDRGTGA